MLAGADEEQVGGDGEVQLLRGCELVSNSYKFHKDPCCRFLKSSLLLTPQFYL